MNLKDKILSRPNAAKSFPVPEWDCEIFIRKISSRDLADLQKHAKDGKLDIEKIVAVCIVDENGKRIFAEDEVDQLATKELDVMQKISAECLKFNGMDKDSEVEKKENL